MTDSTSIFTYKAYTTAFDTEVSASELFDSLTNVPLTHNSQTDDGAPVKSIVAAPHFGARPLVTLLVDHSGSMKGVASQWTVAAIRRLGGILEKSGIAFEILGYTTVSWHGGQSRKKWIRDGMPIMPGRICDLLHIVYRDASTPSPTWARDLEILNRPEVLKENIDGEALLWAHERSRAFAPDFWLCIVISDGAPVDDATLLANEHMTATPFSILQDHLIDVIAALDAELNTQIAGFGVTYDVSQYYEDSDCVYMDIEASDDRLSQFVSRLLTSRS